MNRAEMRHLPRLLAARGFSVVELMVAVTIGAILLGGAITLFVNNKHNYRTTSDLSQLQENARFALDLMVRDLRMVGYFGCHNDINRLTNNLGGVSGDLWDTSNPIEGYDNAQATWSPTNYALDADDPIVDAVAVRNGTDAITVRYLAGGGQRVTAWGGNSITVAADPGILALGVAGVADCGWGDIFQVTALTGGNTVLSFGISLSRAYGPNVNVNESPTVAPFRAVRYYIGNRPNFGPALYQKVIQGATPPAVDTQLLIEGVENMQILYGVDNNADGVPDNYLVAGDANLSTAAQWANVVSVKIGLLLRTLDEYGQDTDTRIYHLFTGQSWRTGDPDPCDPAADIGCVDPGDLRVRRRVFGTTAFLRNRQ